MWPSHFVGGQSLRRALQVNPGVSGAYRGGEMTALLLATLLAGSVGQEIGTPWRGGDLLPERGAFSEDKPRPYEIALSDLLLPDALERRCVFVARPSFESEWAVYVSSNATSRIVVLRVLRRPLSAEMMAELPSKPPTTQFLSPGPRSDPKAIAVAAKFVKQSESPISLSMAVKLERAWKSVLTRVRYSDELQRMLAGADGTSYHVSQCSTEGCLAGMTSSPLADSVAGRVVAIGEAMRTFVLDSRSAAEKEAALQRELDALATTLANDEKPRNNGAR